MLDNCLYDNDLENNDLENNDADEIDIRNASDEEIKTYLYLFFKQQKKPNGTPISNEELMTQEYISWVRSFDFAPVVQITYAALEENKYAGLDYVFVMGQQRRARKLEIPKKYSNGLILVYLKLVMGYDL